MTKTTFPKQTRTDRTVQDYLALVEQFVRRVQDIHSLPPDQRPSEREMADFFVELKPNVCASSWRRYEAAIRAKIDHDGEWQDEVLHDLLSNRAREGIKAGSALPASAKRTSRKKQKAVAFEDLMKLVHELRSPSNVQNRAILADCLIAQSVVGARPIEWWKACYLDNGGQPILNIMNAKSTNGRGNGAERDFDLADLSHETREALRRTVEWANNFPSREAFDTAIATLSKLLTRTCAKVFPDGRVKICFYTLRHQMIANTKKTFQEIVGGDEASQCVAALSGHKTNRTADKHYAKSKSAWGPDQRQEHCLPNPSQVATVEITHNAPAPLHLGSKGKSKGQGK